MFKENKIKELHSFHYYNKKGENLRTVKITHKYFVTSPKLFFFNSFHVNV